MSENILIRFGWRNVLPLLLLSLRSDDAEARQLAEEQIAAMAEGADLNNAAEEAKEALRAGENASVAQIEGADIERDTHNGIVILRPVSSVARQAVIDLKQEMLGHGGVYYMTPAMAAEAEKLLQDQGFVIADDTIRVTL